jgi:hypothetical protein
VKFSRRSLYDARVLQGATFDVFVLVDDWVPPRLVTATEPNPLPRKATLLRASTASARAPGSRLTSRNRAAGSEVARHMLDR